MQGGAFGLDRINEFCRFLHFFLNWRIVPLNMFVRSRIVIK